jgi:hypothetical protein
MPRTVLALTAAAAATVVLVFAAQAGAANETVITGKYTNSESFLDPGPTAACGFPVTFSFNINGTFSFRLDANGNPVSATDHEIGTVSESANGITLTGHTADQFITFFPLQEQYEVGLNGVFTLPGGGLIAIDVGRLVATFDGTLLFVNGPHDVLNGNDAALCAALTP